MKPLALSFLLVLLAAACSEPDEKPSNDTTADTGPGADVGVSSDASNNTTTTTPDGGGGDEWCPVVGYEACDGDLLGTWVFRSLCPEDAAAAAALCEHPYDDREICTGQGNEAMCDGDYSGTLTFNEDGTADVDAVNTLIASWNFTDECLADISREATPEGRCLGLGTDRLTCSYEGHCTCVGMPIVQEDTTTVSYTVGEMGVQLGDDPPATYCVDGDRLTMDYAVYHPVSWRYWVLERP